MSVEQAACDALGVTAYVDGVLDPAARAEVEGHLAACAACREQEAFERGLRQTLRALPEPPLPPRLALQVRRRMRPARRPISFRYLWLATAAGILMGVLWGRGTPGFVAWQLARDHVHCFSRARLQAQVWSGDPAEVTRWFAERGTDVPLVPAAAGGLDLVGARFCPLLDRRVGHLYYGSREKSLSVFVVPGPLRIDRPVESEPDDHIVHIRRSGGATLALVSSDPHAITAFRKAFERSVADGRVAMLGVEHGPEVW